LSPKVVHLIAAARPNFKRRGKTVARPEPTRAPDAGLKPWEQLRALGGRVHATAGESVLKDEDCDAAR
jgi:hypothetical protein